MNFELILVPFAVALGVYSSMRDIENGIIPRKPMYLAVVVGIAVNTLASVQFGLYAAVCSAVAFVGGYVLYKTKGWGGGDVRLWAAYAALMPGYFIETFLLGCVFAMPFLLRRKTAPFAPFMLAGFVAAYVLRLDIISVFLGLWP